MPIVTIVTFAPGDRADAEVGTKVFLSATKGADGGLAAERPLVGKDGLRSRCNMGRFRRRCHAPTQPGFPVSELTTLGTASIKGYHSVVLPLHENF